MKRLMIDVETLDTEAGGVILQIAALVFTKEAVPDVVEGGAPTQFSAQLDWRAQSRDGCTISDRTWDWWLEQSGDLRCRVLDPTVCLRAEKALTGLADFIAAVQPEEVWSHGGMDLMMLDWHFKKYGVKCPWDYRMKRDTRTVFAVMGDRRVKLGPHQKHDALWDCWSQAVGVREALTLAHTVHNRPAGKVAAHGNH